MQQLQLFHEHEQFKAIIEAIVYGYPGLTKAVGLRPPHAPTQPTANTPPPLFDQLGCSVLVVRPSVYSGRALRLITAHLFVFLETIEMPMYAVVGAHEHGMGVFVHIWNDNTQRMLTGTISDKPNLNNGVHQISIPVPYDEVAIPCDDVCPKEGTASRT